MALADISVEQGQDNADAMVIQHKDIAIKLIDRYWQQKALAQRVSA